MKEKKNIEKYKQENDEELNKNKKINLKSFLKKNLKFIILILIIILIIVGIAVYFNVFYRKTLNISKYVYVEYSGFNEYGKVTAYLDTDGLEDEFETEKQYEKFLEYYRLEVDPNSNLSNSDEITVSITLSNENWLDNNKLKLDNDQVTFTVEGLEDATKVDVFETLEIEVTGYSPELKISVNNNSSDEFIKTVSYSLNKSYGLSNGDTITITANYDEDEAYEKGIIVPENTMEYTIEGYGYYIETVSDLGETAIATITQELYDSIDAHTSSLVSGVGALWNLTRAYGLTDLDSLDNVSKSEPELVNLYLLTGKNTSSNIIYGIFKTTFTDTVNGTSKTWFFISHVNDVAILNSEIANYENLDFDAYSDYEETAEDLYTEFIDTKKTDYVIETIQ